MVVKNLVYLARPIDKTGEHEDLINVACNYVRDILITCGPELLIFDPGGGCYRLNKFDDSNRPLIKLAVTLRNANEAIIRISNVVVVLYLTKVPTFGLVTEVDLCHRENIPVVIITDEAPSLYLQGMVAHPEQIVVCTEFDDFEHVDGVDNPDTYRAIATAIEAAITVGLERVGQ